MRLVGGRNQENDEARRKREEEVRKRKEQTGKRIYKNYLHPRLLLRRRSSAA